MRSCVVCGSFYEFDKIKLENQIKSCFVSENGPGLPEKQSKKEICKKRKEKWLRRKKARKHNLKPNRTIKHVRRGVSESL